MAYDFDLIVRLRINLLLLCLRVGGAGKRIEKFDSTCDFVNFVCALRRSIAETTSVAAKTEFLYTRRDIAGALYTCARNNRTIAVAKTCVRTNNMDNSNASLI